MSCPRAWGRWLLGGIFIAAGAAHLVVPDVYVTAMPGWLPEPYALVLISGVAELAGGIGVLVPNPRIRRAAGWGLAALLVAVYPANVDMATAQPSAWWLWARLPMQGALVAWALRASGALPRPGYSRSKRAAASAA